MVGKKLHTCELKWMAHTNITITSNKTTTTVLTLGIFISIPIFARIQYRNRAQHSITVLAFDVRFDFVSQLIHEHSFHSMASECFGVWFDTAHASDVGISIKNDTHPSLRRMHRCLFQAAVNRTIIGLVDCYYANTFTLSSSSFALSLFIQVIIRHNPVAYGYERDNILRQSASNSIANTNTNTPETLIQRTAKFIACAVICLMINVC